MQFALLLVAIIYTFQCHCFRGSFHHAHKNVFHWRRSNLHRSKQLKVTTIDIEPSCHLGGARLDTYLASVFPNQSRTYFANLCETGHVFIGCSKSSTWIPRNKSYRVSHGDKIQITADVDLRKETTIEHAMPEDIPLQVLFEDEELVVINKASGMAMYPSSGTPSGTFVNALLHYIQKKGISQISIILVVILHFLLFVYQR